MLLLHSFGLHPGFELPDGIALHRQLDMGVEGIDFLARGVAHEGLPHVLQDPGLHQPGVERVAKIVKAGVPDACPSNGCLPCRLDLLDRTAFEGEDRPFRHIVCERGEEVRESRGKRDLAALSANGFAVSDEEQAAVEVDVLRALGEEFSPPHPGVERRDDEVAKVGRCFSEQLCFFDDAQDRPWLPSLPREPDAGERV